MSEAKVEYNKTTETDEKTIIFDEEIKKTKTEEELNEIFKYLNENIRENQNVNLIYEDGLIDINKEELNIVLNYDEEDLNLKTNIIKKKDDIFFKQTGRHFTNESIIIIKRIEIYNSKVYIHCTEAKYLDYIVLNDKEYKEHIAEKYGIYFENLTAIGAVSFPITKDNKIPIYEKNGTIRLFGGFANPIDKTPEETARREVMEELNRNLPMDNPFYLGCKLGKNKEDIAFVVSANTERTSEEMEQEHKDNPPKDFWETDKILFLENEKNELENMKLEKKSNDLLKFAIEVYLETKNTDKNLNINSKL